MPYVTSIERLAHQEGMLQSSRENVVEVLQVRLLEKKKGIESREIRDP